MVHLGNVGDRERGDKHDGSFLDEVKGDKTRRYAQRFQDVDFIGIDVKRLPKEPEERNWRQVQADFLEGLNGLEDNSVKGISSEVAVGYYDNGGCRDAYDKHFWDRIADYTSQVIALAYRKLENGGKLMIVFHKAFSEEVEEAFRKSPFKPENVKFRPLTELEYQRTHWTRWSRDRKDKLVQFVAEK